MTLAGSRKIKYMFSKTPTIELDSDSTFLISSQENIGQTNKKSYWIDSVLKLCYPVRHVFCETATSRRYSREKIVIK